MRQIVHIISDLHLGGKPGDASGPGFQMCPPASHALLAEFINKLPPSTDAILSRLVVNGDIVDFLAEQPFEAFSASEEVALEKLNSIFSSTAVVWDALRRFVSDKKGRLTLLLGNHDIELSFPRVREMMADHLGQRAVHFVYDNEALTIGPLLIEHGNRFDAWNAVPHGALRRVRSQLSRRLPVAPEFPAMPGSRLVIDVINDLKKKQPFIDLLKPEGAAAMPIAAALGLFKTRDIWLSFSAFKKKWAVDFDEDREPLDETMISAEAEGMDEDMLDLAHRVEDDGELAETAATSRVGSTLTDWNLKALFKVMRSTGHWHRDTFDVGKEEDKYLVPAQRSARAGFQVVAYGHTHLCKQVELIGEDGQHAVYLNTGTWADLMRVPDGIWKLPDAEALDLFRRFAGDLSRGSLDSWRQPMPTYARVDIEDDEIRLSEVRFADNDEVVTTDGVLQRLGMRVGS